MLRAVDHAARNDPVLEHAAIGIDVAKKEIERGNPLLQPGFDAGPFLGGYDARQKIRRNDPFGRLIVGIDGEGDALVEEGLFAGLLAAAQLFRVEFGKFFVQRRAMRPDRAVGGEHLVIGAVEDVILVRRIAAGLRRTPHFVFQPCNRPMLHMRSEA